MNGNSRYKKSELFARALNSTGDEVRIAYFHKTARD